MAQTTAEAIYEQAIKQLPATERLKLIEKIAHDLSAPEPPKRHDWMSLRGVAPNLLGGKEAQEWVLQSRRESDERHER